jgi:hypothetical protein
VAGALRALDADAHETSSSVHDVARRDDHRHRDDPDRQDRRLGHDLGHDRDHRVHRNHATGHRDDLDRQRDADRRDDPDRQCRLVHDRLHSPAVDPCAHQCRPDAGHHDPQELHQCAEANHRDDGTHLGAAESDDHHQAVAGSGDRCPGAAESDDHSAPNAAVPEVDAAVAEQTAVLLQAAVLQVALRLDAQARRAARHSSPDAQTKSLRQVCPSLVSLSRAPRRLESEWSRRSLVALVHPPPRRRHSTSQLLSWPAPSSQQSSLPPPSWLASLRQHRSTSPPPSSSLLSLLPS